MSEAFLAIELPSLANKRMHWAAKARLVKQQRRSAALLMRSLVGDPPSGPMAITLTRVGARVLDKDNLAACFKGAQDGVADWLGIDDGSPLLDWRYEQRTGKPHGVRVRIERAHQETGL